MSRAKAIRAAAHGLAVTAGSDFHGKSVKPDVDLCRGGIGHSPLLNLLKKRRKGRVS